MPTYLYKNIETGEIYELTQSMRDEAYTAHPELGVPVKRILARPSIAFKGSGFYVNDSRPKEKSSEKSSGGASAGASSAKGGSAGSSGTTGAGTGSAKAKGGE